MSRKEIEVPLSTKGLKTLSKNILEIKKVIEDEKFMEYMKECIMNTLINITQQELSTYNDIVENFETREYILHHKSEIKGDTIYIWNDSKIEVTPDKFSPDNQWKRSTYPNFQISLSKIVEYGIGIRGKDTQQENVDSSWQYDVRQYGNNGWTYIGSDGNYHNTIGFEGRLIFHKLELEVRKNAQKWFQEYITKNYRGSGRTL